MKIWRLYEKITNLDGENNMMVELQIFKTLVLSAATNYSKQNIYSQFV